MHTSSPYSVMCGGIGGHCSKLFSVNEIWGCIGGGQDLLRYETALNSVISTSMGSFPVIQAKNHVHTDGSKNYILMHKISV